MFRQRSGFMEWLEALTLAVLLALIVRAFVAEMFIVDGQSMFPTLNNGDRLLVNKTVYYFTKPRPGDVIVFRYPANPKEDFIKRVIATEGQIVEIKNGDVFVNKHRIIEHYINNKTPGRWGPEIVPDGTVFVLGDNRSHSKDSRFEEVGFVPLNNVIGRAEVVVWPPEHFGKIP